MLAKLPKVRVGRHSSAMATSAERYRRLVGDELIDAVIALARDLKGVRICHLNSTASGGGLAELLVRHLPVLQALGLAAEWRLIHGRAEFFTVTKAFHNALQGAHYDLRKPEQALYLEVNEESTKLLEADYDVYIVHDPQPLAIRHFAGDRGAKRIWRCHIDTATPDEGVSRFLRPFIEAYDAVTFTLLEFRLPELAAQRLTFIAPAIDP